MQSFVIPLSAECLAAKLVAVEFLFVFVLVQFVLVLIIHPHFVHHTNAAATTRQRVIEATQPLETVYGMSILSTPSSPWLLDHA